MVSEAGPKVIAVDSRGKSVKNRVQAENIKRQGTTAMVIPCLCSFLFESRTVHHKKIPRPNGPGIVVEHSPQHSNLYAGISLLRSVRFKPRNGETSARFNPCS
jgi:hypothetical protein